MLNYLDQVSPLSRGPLAARRAARRAARSGAPAVRITRPQQQQVQQPVEPYAEPLEEVAPLEEEEDDTGLASKIASGALTAVGALGNLLDLPGSSVRDILSGKNPLDQWLDPFSHTEQGTSTTGRQLLETYGMRENKETGWVPLEDPGEFARDVAGFGAELALDPLGWMTGWMSSAAGKTAKVAKAAATAADVAQATKKAGTIRRAASKIGDTFDAIDPGHQLGRAVHRNETTRKWVQNAGKGVRGTVGAGIRSASPIVRGAKRWADRVDPFPSGGERQRFASQIQEVGRSRGIPGEQTDEYMLVTDARARAWAKDINKGAKTEDAHRSADEYFKDLSIEESDIDSVREGALLQGEALNFDQGSDYTFTESDYRPEVASWAKERFGDRVAPNGKLASENFARWFGDSQVKTIKKFDSEDLLVVDPNGIPIPVYHGTPSPGFDIFDPAKKGKGPFSGKDTGESSGFFFTSDADVANRFTSPEGTPMHRSKTGSLIMEEGGVYPVYLSMKNPLIIPFAVTSDPFDQRSLMDFIEQAKRDGHDGIISKIDDGSAVDMPAGKEKGRYGGDPRGRDRETIASDIGITDASGEIDSVRPMYIVFDPTQIKSVNNRGTFDPSNPNILFQGERASLWSHPRDQRISSKDTSGSWMPSIVGDAARKFTKFVKGGINADIGGGKYDNMTEHLQGIGVQNVIYDPFNRTSEWNNDAVRQIAGGQADTATISNVLNVIEESSFRHKVIAQAADAIKADGEAYFTVHWDSKKAAGSTTQGYQSHWKPKDYVSEIEKHFGKVEIKGKHLVASKPIKDQLPDILFQGEQNKAMWYSKLDRAIADMPEKVSKEQLLGILRKKGVKKEEVELAKLDELFADRPVKPSVLDDALSFIRRNVDDDAFDQVEFNVGYMDDNGKLDLAEAHGWERPKERIARKSVTREELQEWLADHAVEIKETWKGGEGGYVSGNALPVVYGDVADAAAEWLGKTSPDFVFNRPQIVQDALDHGWKPTGDLKRRLHKPMHSGYSSPGGENYRELLLRADGVKADNHFFEKDTVVHSRMSDRVGDDGSKILHVDEIQSDLHNQVRQGYHRHPKAPFKGKGYIELALKRLLREAAEGGYDKLSLNSGDAVMALSMGGRRSGNQMYYDEIHVNILNKLAKKFGVRVKKNDEVVNRLTGEILSGIESGREMFPEFDRVLLNLERGVDDVDINVPVYSHTLEITPAMRKSLLSEPQPLFQAGDAAGTAARGAAVFEDGKRVIHAFKSADISTLVHESAHVFRRDLSNKQLDAAESAIDKMIDGNVRGADGKWTREAEEAFASGFERYLRDGTAASEQLKSTFEKFKEWLTEIYQHIIGTPLEKDVSPELRSVFDSMLQHGESAGRIRRAGGKAVHMASDVIRRTPDAARDARTKLSQAFERHVRNASTPQVQQGARIATDAEDALLNEYRGAFVPILDEIDEMAHDLTKGIDADKWSRNVSNQIRYALETRNLIIDDVRLQEIDKRLHEPLRQFKEYQNVILEQAQEAGLNVTELQDDMIDYLHRQASERNTEWMKANGVDSVRGGSGAEAGAGVGRRSQALKGGLSEAIDEVVADPRSHMWMDDAHKADPDLKNTDAHEEVIEKVAKRLEKVADGRILKDMKKMDDDDKFVMTDLETGFEKKMGAKDLGELKPDTRIQAGDKVQWTADGALQFAEPQVVKAIVQHDGHSFVTFEGQTAGAPLGQVNHWDDIAGNTRPTSSTRMGRTVKQKMKKDGKVLKDVDGNTRTEEKFESFEHVMESRFKALARHMYDRPIYRETGGLYTSPLHAMHTGARAVISGITNARLTTETLVEGFRSGILEMPFTGRGPSMTLAKLFDNSALSAMDRRKAYQKIVDGNQDRFGDDWVEQMQKAGRDEMFEAEGGESLQLLEKEQKARPAGPVGTNLDDSKFFEHVGRIRINPDIAKDITRAWEFHKADATGLGKSVGDNFRSFTALFKAGVLNHPARFTRDGVSGQIQNMTHGIFSYTALKSMFNVLFSRPDKFLQELPQVQDYMKARKWEVTPENATKAVRQMYAARRGHSSSIYHDLDQADDALDASQDFKQLRGTLLGRASGPWDLLKEIGATAVGRRGGTFDPRDVAGVHWGRGKDGGRRAESMLAPVQAGELTGRYMDDSNRLVGFIESMRQGVNADEAMKIVDDVQLNYDPRTFTPTEQMLKKFFPFYSFFTREVKYLSNELMTNPAGRLGKLIRLQAKGARRTEDDEGNYIPEYARTQLSIPVGKSADGGTTYFSGLGLMHDDPVEKLMTLAFDPRASVRKGLSQLNPLIKGPLESVMGRSTWQGGPLGGRDLSSMDPTIGRIMTNIGLQDETPSGRAAPVMGQRWIEEVAANSPAARILSNIKTAGDDRKSYAQRLMNLSTGMRFTTVSPRQSRGALQELSNSILKEAGARKFSQYTPPTDDELAEIEKTNPEAATKLRAIRRNRELVNQERRAGIRRNEMQAVQQAINSGQMPAMTKTQQERYDRWVKNFGADTSPDKWTQYVYQRTSDGSPKRSGIKDWKPKKKK